MPNTIRIEGNPNPDETVHVLKFIYNFLEFGIAMIF